MKIQLLKEWTDTNSPFTVWPTCSVLEVEEPHGNALIADGTAKQVNENTRPRIGKATDQCVPTAKAPAAKA